MNKKNLSSFLKHQTIIIITSLILVILITGSISHAYFTASVSGSSSSVTATSGNLNITLNSTSPNSSNGKIYIQADPSGQDNPYTLTIKNDGDVAAAYDIVVINTSGGIAEHDIKYKLTKSGETSGTSSPLGNSTDAPSSYTKSTVIKHVTTPLAVGAIDKYDLSFWISSSMAESSQDSILSSNKKVNLQIKIVSKASADSSQLNSIS